MLRLNEVHSNQGAVTPQGPPSIAGSLVRLTDSGLRMKAAADHAERIAQILDVQPPEPTTGASDRGPPPSCILVAFSDIDRAFDAEITRLGRALLRIERSVSGDLPHQGVSR